MAFESAFTALSAAAPLRLGALSPARKLAAAAVFSLGVSLLTNPATALCACLLPAFLIAAGYLPVRTVLRRLLPVNAFFLFLWLFLPLEIASGSVHFTHSGLLHAAVITIKGNAIAATLLALAGTSSINASCRALLALHVPEKLVVLLLLTYGHLSFMADEAARLFSAAKLRGFRPANSLSSYKTFGYLIAMLLLRSWQRSQRVASAMRLRGFSGRFPLLDTAAPQQPMFTRTANCLLLTICVVTALLLAADKLLLQ